MKISLDAMGGDHGSAPNVEGAKLALAEYPEITALYIVGREDELREQMTKAGLRDPRAEIINATQVVEMSESAVSAIRKKKDSSISVAVDLVKDGRAECVVSAGHTGAAVAACQLKLRTIDGADRAGILAQFPNVHGWNYMIDAGANVDSRPIHLVQQAIMAATYVKYTCGKPSPRVGIMANGEEDSKGNEVTKEVFAMLTELKGKGLNFIGNVEGRDIFMRDYDVTVCDGFVGNVLLKGCEGTAKAMFTWLKQDLTRTWWRKLGAMIAKEGFRETKARGDYEQYGGSPLLGVNGGCIIAHGSSGPVAIKNAIRVGKEAISHGVNPHIKEDLARYLGGK